MELKFPVHDWNGNVVKDIVLNDSVFSSPFRKDLITRLVLWQLAKRRSGNHKTKGISDISGTTKKPFRQKGTGRARQGSLRSPHYRGGAVIFGPVVRSHSYDLPKKVREMGLRSLLSSYAASGSLEIIEDFSLGSAKTKDVSAFVKGSVLIVTGGLAADTLKRSISNIPHLDVLPDFAINAYDILRHKRLLVSVSALSYLEKRLQKKVSSEKYEKEILMQENK